MALTISNNSANSICGLLVTKGLIAQDIVDQAKKSSANSGKNIINILLDNKSVTEDQIANVIAENNGLPFVPLSEKDINKEHTA